MRSNDMMRQLAVLTFLLSLMSTSAGAQTMYTLKENADVHNAPTTSSPVIGHAVRGRTLELSRDVGDWVEVAWTEGTSHSGYIRVRFGMVPLAAFRDLPALRTGLPSSASASVTSAPAATPQSTTPPAPPSKSAVKSPDPLAFELPPHTTGFGLRMDPRFRDFGGAARLWSPHRFGAQLEVMRSTTTSELAPGHLTTWQFSPAVLYALPDLVQSSIWIRPYAGTGLDLARSTVGGLAPDASAHDTAFGTKVFGGAEMTLAGAPQVGVSVDVGYHWLESSFTTYELGGARVTLAGHWYIK
jgi:hypothetical protein